MHQRPFYLTLRALLSALLLLLFATQAQANAEPKAYQVTAADGVQLAVQESGNPQGQPIILIHGLLGSRLNWSKQLQDPALQQYRLITYDLRGHGLSSKPDSAEAYTDGRRWADDLNAVITATKAVKPVLVGWSLGGAVISNYLTYYGDKNLSGAMYVDGVIELKADQITSHPAVYRDMISTDLQTHLEGERTFLRLCFNQQPDQDTFDLLLANAALASWQMQQSVQSMSVAAEQGLGKAQVPIMLIYGEKDALVMPTAAIARAREFNKNIQTSLYANSGHAPFLEEAERFNQDLLHFVKKATSH
ncbi:alpha/beta fold hydrolase [Pokkaliibacter sp. CJK22405]|uniref:alpha/beta fold hydrolase n=1 Tax=Pokkaliibacter sp. CJK22405 TaxID=3384615 RepID=UPI0039852E60